MGTVYHIEREWPDGYAVGPHVRTHEKTPLEAEAKRGVGLSVSSAWVCAGAAEIAVTIDIPMMVGRTTGRILTGISSGMEAKTTIVLNDFTSRGKSGSTTTSWPIAAVTIPAGTVATLTVAALLGVAAAVSSALGPEVSDVTTTRIAHDAMLTLGDHTALRGNPFHATQTTGRTIGTGMSSWTTTVTARATDTDSGDGVAVDAHRATAGNNSHEDCKHDFEEHFHFQVVFLGWD